MFTVYHKDFGPKQLRDSVDVREHLSTGVWFNTAEEANSGIATSKGVQTPEVTKLKKDLKDKEASLKELKEQNSDLQNQVATLQNKLADAAKEMEALKGANVILANENNALKQKPVK